MKNLNYIFLFSLIILSASCSNEQDDTSYGVFASTSVTMSVVNEQGNDLLDPSTPNYIKIENIELYHEIDGELIKYFEGNLDYSEGYKLYNPYDLGFNDKYVFCVLATDASGSEDLNPVTYIKWNEMDTDTIQCEYYKEIGYLNCTKVWFNGNEVWVSPGNSGEGRWFQIVK